MTTLTAAPFRPWLQIWAHPRRTVRQLVDSSSLHIELLLAAGSGVVQSIVQASSTHIGARAPASTILFMTLAVGSAWGLLQLHVLAGTLYLVGRWTGAPTQFRRLRTALAWAAVPQIALLSLWLLGTLAFGRLLYIEAPAVMPRAPFAVLAQGLLGLATVVCAGWWIVLQVLAVAEVQEVSAWRALLNFLAVVLILGVLVTVIVLVGVVLRVP